MAKKNKTDSPAVDLSDDQRRLHVRADDVVAVRSDPANPVNTIVTTLHSGEHVVGKAIDEVVGLLGWE